MGQKNDDKGRTRNAEIGTCVRLIQKRLTVRVVSSTIG